MWCLLHPVNLQLYNKCHAACACGPLPSKLHCVSGACCAPLSGEACVCSTGRVTSLFCRNVSYVSVSELEGCFYLYSVFVSAQMITLIAVCLNGANLYGYVRCRLGKTRSITSAASNFVGQQLFRGVSTLLYPCGTSYGLLYKRKL